jgi:hypothetical protein
MTDLERLVIAWDDCRRTSVALARSLRMAPYVVGVAVAVVLVCVAAVLPRLA